MYISLSDAAQEGRWCGETMSRDNTYHFARKCFRKRQYSEKEARRIAWVMMQENDDLLAAYYCTFCGYWHVGHPNPKQFIGKNGV